MFKRTNVSDWTKVADFKDLLAEITFVSANDQRLIYKETILDDDQILRSYGLQAHHAIHLEVDRNPLFETTPPSNTTTGKLMDEEMIMIEIICSNRDTFSVGSSVRSKVADFKNLLARITSFPANRQRLSYKGIILEDDQTLSSYGLQVDHAIHLEAVPNPPFATTPPSNTTTGGLGLPGLDCPTGGMPDMMSQLIPTIFQMMQSFLSNPQFMKLIVDQNPQLHGMLDSISQLKETMQNPQVVRQLQMLQQMMSSPLLPELNQQSPLGILQPGATAVPPEQLYATQLSQLQEMRFFDTLREYQGSTCLWGQCSCCSYETYRKLWSLM